ncbi:phage minor tail protein L [Thermomonas hydrothermalis]|uniref:phage minor tail protein L n=1 Tax=Thermomonas hydrothermalis TaxID=213588 RepID=UPI002353EAF0|nr:phage minor tail protein L [Thermomonas hydrothermalis]
MVNSTQISDVGSGWVRCAVSFDVKSGAGSVFPSFALSDGTTSVYAGDGVSGVYMWGFQVEAGAFATSYIPTTTAAVTRAADYATVTDLSTLRFNVSAGALSVTARAPASLAQAATLLSYNDNSTNNVIRFRMEAGGALKAEVIAGGVTQASLALGTLTAGAQFRAAMSYAANDIRGCLNGGTVQSDASASIPTVNRLMIGRGASGEWWNSTIRRHRYWSRALTNAELQTVTSGGAISDVPSFDMDTSSGSLAVYTLAPFNPTADPNQYLSRDVWVVDRKSSENRVFIEFELAAPIDVAGVMLPRRQVVANVCAWRYRSAECGYAGGPVADRDDNPTTNPALDACGKRLASCKLRFGQTGVLPFGGFPGTRRLG